MNDYTPTEAQYAAYAAGVAAAEAFYSQQPDSECRPFDRAIWGMARVMALAGVMQPADAWSNELGDFASDWHNPLASATPECSLDRWVKAFPLKFQGFSAEKNGPDVVKNLLGNKPCRGYERYFSALQWVPRQDYIEREAEELLDRDIKTRYPGLRKNTKKYKSLAEGQRASARQVATHNAWANYNKLVTRFDFWHQGDFAEECRKLDEYTQWLTRRAAQLLAINQNCSVGLHLGNEFMALATRVRDRKAYFEKLRQELWDYLRQEPNFRAPAESTHEQTT